MTAMAGTIMRRNRGRHVRAGLLLVFRLLALIVGGYFLSAATVTLGTARLASLGIDRSETVVLMAMLGFILYLLVLLWGFAERRLPRLLAVTLGGAGATQGLVCWLSMAAPVLS